MKKCVSNQFAFEVFQQLQGFHDQHRIRGFQRTANPNNAAQDVLKIGWSLSQFRLRSVRRQGFHPGGGLR